MSPTELAHHPTLSPSAFPALAQCPQYRSGEAGEAAERGQRIHAIAEAWLKGGQLPPADPEESDEALWAATNIASMLGPDAEIEKRVRLLDDNFQEVTFGTVDAYCKGKLLDLKTGEKRDYRRQMAVYALALLDRDGLDEMECIIVYSKFREVEKFALTRSQAEALVWPVVDAVRAEGPASPCDYCSWCSKVATCPAINARVTALVAGREDWAPATWRAQDISDPETMAKALDIATLVEKWAAEVRDFAKDMAFAGTEIPGWRLEDRGGKREVKDIQAALNATGLEPAEMLAACSLSLTKLEKAYQDKTGLKAAEAKRELARVLGDLVTQGAGSLVLKRAKA